MQNVIMEKTQSISSLLSSMVLDARDPSKNCPHGPTCQIEETTDPSRYTCSTRTSSSKPPAKKAAMFDAEFLSTTNSGHSRNTLPSSTRLPMFKDGFVRVCRSSRSRRRPRTPAVRLSVGLGPLGQGGGMLQAAVTGPVVRSAAPEKSSRPRRIIFGETDYLRDKLGFCMPPVKQTLASESRRAGEGEQSLGFQYTSKQRLHVMQQLFLERAATHRQHTSCFNSPRSPSTKCSGSHRAVHNRKGNLESKQYIIRLDANTRRSKYIDERAKFALSREIFQQESKKLLLDHASIHDLELAAAARSKSQKISMKNVKIMAPTFHENMDGSEDLSDNDV